MLSAVVPTIGRPEYLDKALASLVAQSEPFDEIVVFDNSPGQDARDRSKLRDDPRLRWEFSGSHLDMVDSLNAAVASTRERYAIFIGDDDLALPDLSRNVRAALVDSKMVYVPFARMDAQGVVSAVPTPISGTMSATAFRWERMSGRLDLVVPGIAFPRDLFIELGGFRSNGLPGFAHIDDDLWFRVAASAGTVCSTGNIDWTYRVHDGQPTARYRLKGISQAAAEYAEALQTALISQGINAVEVFPPQMSAKGYADWIATGRVANLLRRSGATGPLSKIAILFRAFADGVPGAVLVRISWLLLRSNLRSRRVRS